MIGTFALVLAGAVMVDAKPRVLDSPVRSFVLTPAYREARECLSQPECAVLV